MPSMPAELPLAGVSISRRAADNRRPMGVRSQRARAELLVRSAVHYRPEQVLRRVWRSVWGPLDVRLPRRLRSTPPVRPQRRQPPPRALWSPSPQWTPRPAELAAGQLRLLNLPRTLGRPLDWSLRSWPDAPPLWAFHLHYHEFLCDLTDAALAWQVVSEWLDAHPQPSPVAWHPYVIARRLPVWARLFLTDPPPDGQRLLDSMARQTRWLYGHVEHELQNNHVWEDAKALLTMGCFFAGPEADRWRYRGVRLLLRCLRDQVLPSGEHFERSPAYQADLARGLDDAAWWLAPLASGRAAHLGAVARRMRAHLDGIRHPDGGLPLFGDSTLDGPLACAGPPPPDGSGWVGDVYVRAMGDTRLLFDAGDMGPDHVPAHAHADLLGFELSIAGARAIVDSGTWCYAGPERDLYRRASAHNVLLVDGEPPAETFSTFRVGRRGHVIERDHGRLPGAEWVRAAHDGFRHIGVERVERFWLFADDGGPWIAAHRVLGRRRGEARRLLEHVHWHPTVAPALSGRGARLHPSGALWELAAPDATVQALTAPYAPRFYLSEPHTVLRLEASACIAWSISFDGAPCEPLVVATGSGVSCTYTHRGARRTVHLPGARL